MIEGDYIGSPRRHSGGLDPMGEIDDNVHERHLLGEGT
jgi:hypothetical protein